MGAQVSLSWLNMQPPLGQGHQGCALVWALLSPDPAAHCPRGGTGPAGVTWGLCAVLVIALGVRRAGPEHCKGALSTAGCECPACRAVCHGHPTVTQRAPLTQNPPLLASSGKVSLINQEELLSTHGSKACLAYA